MVVEFDEFVKKYIEKENPLYDFQISKNEMYGKYEEFAKGELLSRLKFNIQMRMFGLCETFNKKQNTAYWIGVKWK